MSNERLRAAIVGGGLTTQSLSERIGVDPKTVERWITKDRIPHRAHRLAVSAALGKDDIFLWPTTDDARSQSASEAEFVAIHPNRGSLTVSTWTSLIDEARESIDLLAFAASFLHDAVPDFDAKLVGKARQGVRVRLLFGDPESEAVRIRGEEEGIGDLLSARCRLTWSYYKPIVDEMGVMARIHGCTLYNSIFRFDDTLLANTHAYGAAASHSPLIHVHRIPGGRLFTSYMQGFERTWEQAKPVSAGDLA